MLRRPLALFPPPESALQIGETGRRLSDRNVFLPNPLSLAKLEGPRPNEEEDELTLWNLWRRGGYVGRRESAR